MVDLSVGGVYVMYDSSASEGSEFDMFFDVPLGEEFPRVYARGRVVRVVMIATHDAFGIGFQFVKFYKNSESVLQQYIDSRLRRR